MPLGSIFKRQIIALGTKDRYILTSAAWAER